MDIGKHVAWALGRPMSPTSGDRETLQEFLNRIKGSQVETVYLCTLLMSGRAPGFEVQSQGRYPWERIHTLLPESV